ncbi:MAG: hypothetical protein WKG00_39795 [Polyangiaceae bacterium]
MKNLATPPPLAFSERVGRRRVCRCRRRRAGARGRDDAHLSAACRTGRCRRRRRRARRRWRLLGRHHLHLGARANLLQPLDDDAVSGGEAAQHQPAVVHLALGVDLAALDLVVLADDERGGLAVGVAGDAALGDDDGLRARALLQPRAHEQPRQEIALGVGDEHPQ